MTPLDALAPFHRAVAAQLRAASFGFIALASITAVIAFALFCFGHAAFTRQPLNLELTTLWSLAHGAGIAGLVGGASTAADRHPRAAFGMSLFGGLFLSNVVFWVGGTLLTITPSFGYSSVSLYVAAAAALGFSLWPRASQNVLAVDFGRARKLIPLERVIAARGARNYAELAIAGEKQTGLVRTTLSELESRFPDKLVRTQRSWLVNPRYLSAVRHVKRGNLVLEMNSGLEVPVSAAYADALLSDPQFVPTAEDSSQRPGREPPLL